MFDKEKKPGRAKSRFKTEEKARFWREEIKKQQASGLSVNQYCKDKNLNPYSFDAWKGKLKLRVRRKSKFGKKIKPGFVSVRVPESGEILKEVSWTRTQIHLPNGVRIEVGEDVKETEVLRLMQTLCGVGHATT